MTNNRTEGRVPRLARVPARDVQPGDRVTSYFGVTIAESVSYGTVADDVNINGRDGAKWWLPGSTLVARYRATGDVFTNDQKEK